MTSEDRNQLTPKERMKRLNAAFDAMSEGLEPAELETMLAAMTDEPRRELSDLRRSGKDRSRGDGVDARKADEGDRPTRTCGADPLR